MLTPAKSVIYLIVLSLVLTPWVFAPADDVKGHSVQAYSVSKGQGDVAELPTIFLSDLPPDARQTLVLIKQGGPFPYPKDGTTFGNREGRLPARRKGYYSEYTVKTPGSRDRGARRIITGSEGEFYYTDDHYKTFKRIKE